MFLLPPKRSHRIWRMPHWFTDKRSIQAGHACGGDSVPLHGPCSQQMPRRRWGQEWAEIKGILTLPNPSVNVSESIKDDDQRLWSSLLRARVTRGLKIQLLAFSLIATWSHVACSPVRILCPSLLTPRHSAPFSWADQSTCQLYDTFSDW